MYVLDLILHVFTKVFLSSSGGTLWDFCLHLERKPLFKAFLLVKRQSGASAVELSFSLETVELSPPPTNSLEGFTARLRVLWSEFTVSLPFPKNGRCF